MPKNESKKYDSSVREKENAPLAKKLRELIPDSKTASALKDYLGVSIQAINLYRSGLAIPKTENLYKIAEFFDISIDYLFGITETKNRDTSIQAVNIVTGLSEGAIVKLHKIKENDRSLLAVVSALLEDSNCEYFLSLLKAIILLEGNDTDLQTLIIDGKEMKLYSSNLMKAVFQAKMLDNIPNLASLVEELNKGGK